MISAFYVSDSDSTDSEQKENLAADRRMLRCMFDPLELSNQAFSHNFRVSKEIFVEILEQITPKFPPIKGRNGLTAKEMLAATLRFLAEGSYQHGVGTDFSIAIAQPTFSKMFAKTLVILEETLCEKWISLEMTPEEQQEARRHFFSKSGIPGVVMSVDGTHIKIIAPVQDRDQHYNRKGFYSINVLLVCDHKMAIRYVDARFSGANHDAHIWSVSGIDDYFSLKHQRGETSYKILGDSAYPSKPWLITPKRNAAPNTPDASYNTRHAKGREIIERTIGMLKNRFRCLLGARQLHYKPEKAAQITNVCCALHNICLARNMDILPENDGSNAEIEQ
ncbi:putative nuclease HARBI1 [Anopheles funestus]|uniref:DDE Tnp4 domain-containing protein n=1 Tax=Anopheles funestus TaxID=62324 RepID=A0A182RR26_ANOFN|nr:putative nuclease HARBI1 [Anopheles funestus]XP_049294072.1 putative nuclease HARBI1 [Anopheles funestus]